MLFGQGKHHKGARCLCFRGESPVVPCSLDPYREHVVARMLLRWVCLRPSVHPSYVSNKHQGIFVSLKGKTPSTNLPIPSTGHTCPATTKQTRSLITTTPPQSSPSLSSDAATPQLSKYFPPYCTLHPRNPTFPQPVHLPLRPFDSQLHSALTHQSRPRHSPARSE
jgi:hypothetical protein